ncbi:MAG TPA: hypothetical protein VIS48_04285 [Candidatus Kryptonia bacterium]
MLEYDSIYRKDKAAFSHKRDKGNRKRGMTDSQLKIRNLFIRISGGKCGKQKSQSLTSFAPRSTQFHQLFNLQFPIICRKIGRGENVFYLDSTRLGQYLNFKNVNIESLSTTLRDTSIQVDRYKLPTQRVDPLKRALEYRSLIHTGIVKNQSELAAYLGTSRMWISKVMKILKSSKFRLQSVHDKK